MDYKDLEVWQIARELSIEVHQLTLTALPAFEQYEEASQIRRSSKSTRSNIVEGFGRRKYKQDYIRFLHYAYASNLETIDHLDTLHETGSLQSNELYRSLRTKADRLGAKLHRFKQGVEKHHRT